MTAEELIEQQKALQPETTVLVEGYETGFDQVVRYRHAQERDDEHQAADRFANLETGVLSTTVLQGVVIRGRRGHRG
ncbi:MAG: hypothetical protein KBT73_05830 [Marinobacter sp.]|nr:hypothetical protein [Marinobacter sp.]